MPRMIVCPVSLSVWTLKVGSSCMSLPRAMPIFSWSALVLGSIATAMTGSGKFMASRMIGLSSSQIVSPVWTFFSPTPAAMSPAQTSLISSRLLACIFKRRPDALSRVLGRVEDGGAGVEVPRVHAEEGELADEGVGHDLEDQGRKRGLVGRRARQLGAHVVVADDRLDVQRRREVVHDRVEQVLDALVLERGAADDRLDRPGDRGAAQGVFQLLLLDLAAVQVLLEKAVVGLGDDLDQLLAVLLGLGFELGRDVHDVELGAQFVVVEVDTPSG